MEKQQSMSIFSCFICSQPFSSRHSLNKGGKVPLVLHCGHSACDSCISRLVNAPGDTLDCHVCNAVSTTSEYYNPAKPELEFPLNTIILGQLVLKCQSGWDDNKISFSMPSKMQSSPRAVICHECVERRAECNCVQCQVPYCGICFNKVHQSARCFKDHVRTDILDSENIEVKCPIHKDQNKQFWCDICSAAACSNCLISTHNGHTISLLSAKNLECFSDLMSSYVNVCNIQNRLRATRKRMTSSLSKQDNTFCKATENEIREHFFRLHGLLIAKENKLLAKLYSPYRGSANSLKNMLQQVDTTIEELDQLLQTSSALIQYDKKYLNSTSYPDVLEKLRMRESTPCHLLISQESQTNAKFTVADDNICYLIETHCDIDADPRAPIYRLVTTDELPVDYQIEPVKSVSLDSVKLMSTLALNIHSDDNRTPSPSVSLHSLDSSSNADQKVSSTHNQSSEPTGNRNFDELVEGCKVLVTVTHAISPNEFYIRRIGLEKKLKEINDTFTQIFTNLKTPLLKRITPGEHFMAQYSQDNQWYRSVAVRVEDNLVTVFYIDFGNTESVRVDKLKVMPMNLMKNDGMAVRCSLHQCQPVNGSWLPQSLSTMLKIIKGPVDLYVIIKMKSEGLLHVDLVRTDSFDEVNLRQALIFLGYAESTDPSSPALKVDTMTNQRSFHSGKTFSNGHIMQVAITHYVDPFQFYARDIKSNYSFNRLSAGMREMYGRKPTYENMLIYHPKKGMIIAALSSYDNQWKRAKIVDVRTDSKVEVNYVDYGNSEVIPYKRMRYLGHKFYKIGQQCFIGRLVDIGPTEGQKPWNAKAISTFESLLQSNTGAASPAKFHVVIHSHRDNSYQVVLYKQQTADMSLCINTALVEEKVAVSTGSNSTVLLVSSKITEDNFNPKGYMEQVSSEIITDEKAPLSSHIGTKIENVSVLPSKESVKTHQTKNEYSKPLFNPDLSSSSSSTSQLNRLPDVVGDQVSYCRDGGIPQDVSQETSSKDTESIKVAVAIVKVVSPSEFYITPVTMMPKLNVMKSEMQKYYSKRADGAKIKNLIENSVCVIKRELEQDWCRAFIVKVNEASVEMLLPDYGEKLEVSKDSIYSLADKFQDLRDGVTRCHLGGLKQPLDDRWPMTSTDEIVEFGEKYDGKIYITKLGQEKANSMPVEVLMKEEKAAGALEPMKVTWTSLNNSLRMRGLALSDGTIDWDLEDYKYTSIQHHIPKLQMDIFKGIPIKYANLAANNDAKNIEDISNAESIFGSTMKLEVASDDISALESATDDDIKSILSSSSPTVETLTAHESKEQYDVGQPELPLALPVPIMPKSWPDALPFSKMEFIANPTNVNYIASIFIQEFQKSVSILKRIEDILDSHCSMSLPMPHDMYWSVGQTCIARYHLDKKWYRGIVEDIKEDNSLSVRLVDYGNLEECTVEDLRKMPLATDIPIQGQFCSIKKIKPLSSDGKWPIAVLDRIHALVVEKHCLVLVSYNSFDQEYNVDNVKLPDGFEMLSLLVKEGRAVHNDASDIAPSINAMDESVTISQESQPVFLTDTLSEQDKLCEIISETTIHDSTQVQHFQTPKVESNDLKTVHQSTSWAAEVEAYAEASEMATRALEDERRRQMFESISDSDEASFHTNNNPSELYDINPTFLQRDDTDVDDMDFGYMYSVIPESLGRFEVEVGSLIQADTVVFQITDSNDLKLCHSREKFHELTNHLQTEAPLQPFVELPQQNGLCCAKYSVDGSWYRALILDVPDEKHVLVKYVDYGNMEKLPLSEIREMKEVWTLYEVQSFEAKLHNIIVAGDMSTVGPRIKYELEEALYGHKLTAKVFCHSPLTVELYDGDCLAYQSLLDSGLFKLIQ